MWDSESIWEIAVEATSASHDARGAGLLATAHRAGFSEVTGIRATRLYLLRGQLDRAAAERLSADLFADPVIEQWSCHQGADWPESAEPVVEVHLLPGVMDPVAISAAGAARELLQSAALGGTGVQVRTAWRYAVIGLTELDRLETLARRILANPSIEKISICGLGRRDELPQRFPEAPQVSNQVRHVRLTGLGDEELTRLSREKHLFLSVEELRAVERHFATLERDPTDLELETIAQTWSEHCVHKTLKSAVVYRGQGFGVDGIDADVERHYDNLLADTIAKATRELALPWCLSVFKDNAGIVDFDERHGVAFKVETHNHPSAIEPYGGAATGAGGCIRDILGCGLGAKPIANTDVFCVADPDFDDDRLPPGVLRPRRILRGIVEGVRDYGNRMGIPTVAGALYFDDRYLANPLVYCGCVGVISKDRIHKEPRRGDKIVLVGGRTGRDGIGGATFSSAELTDTHADEFAHAVQIGNAIEEKKVLDALLRARDHATGCLYTAITDCGAGGLSSAVGEMAHELGAVVDLDKVPLKYAGLRYNEIWLSEAQERMVLAVVPERLAELVAVFVAEEVEASVIGEFTGDGVLRVRYAGGEVGSLDVGFLHKGLPKRRRIATWNALRRSSPTVNERIADVQAMLLERLSSLNCCSREAVFRQYDHEVQGGSAVKPAAGVGEGPSDAAVVRPLLDSRRGVAIGAGVCPNLSDDDPYWMAVLAIDEAIRNVICVGANPDRIAILDNFCWPGCEDEEQLGALVRACQACHDAAVTYRVPFISGKDSLNNQFSLSADDARRLGLPETIAIPGTLLISSLGLVEDVRRCVTSDLKQPGARVWYVSADVRRGGPESAAAMHRTVARIIRSGQATACHDVSDGGLAVCLAEMCIGGARGATVSLDGFATGADARLRLFDESRSAYVFTTPPDVDGNALGGGREIVELGVVTRDKRLCIGVGAKTLVDVEVPRLDAAWRRTNYLD